MGRCLRTLLVGLAFFAGILPLARSAAADTVRLKDGGNVRGRLLVFDRTKVVVDPGCRGGRSEYLWTNVSSISFEEGCKSSPATVKPPEPTCASDNFVVFVISLKDKAAPVFAENVALTGDGIFHFDLFEPWNQAHGARSTVRSVSLVSTCRDRLGSSDPLPRLICSEPRKIAVNFDYRTPLSNKILTNGFSFYIRTAGQPPASFDVEAFRSEVRSAFQSALTLWTSALQSHKALLTDDIRAFVESRTSRSTGGYSMLIPPQVVEVRCPQAATFVIDLVFKDRKVFPRPPLVIAKAQTEGRTIALNVNDIGCFKSVLKYGDDKRLPFEVSDGCLNLIPVMTHELGHAFGLRHIDDPKVHALMDSRFSRDALTPTTRDVEELVAVFSRSIQGKVPGELKMVSSSGVRPPLDFRGCRRWPAGSAEGCD